MSKLAVYNTQMVSVSWADQAGDERIGIFKAPDYGNVTITAVHAIASETVTASTANYWQLVLQDGGATGTATAAIGTAGGTSGWVADTGQAFTLAASTVMNLDAGDWLMVNYDETGTVAPGEVTINVHYRVGQA